MGIRRLLLSIPKKRGFTSLYPRLHAVNLLDLDRIAKAGEIITRERLVKAGLVDRREIGIKILGDGTITKAITIRGIPLSASAREKILAAGGSIE